MNAEFRKYSPRLVEIIREFLRTEGAEAWINAFCALCAEAVPDHVDDIGSAAESFAAGAMGLLTSDERVRFAQLLLDIPDLVNQLRAKIQEIKAQKGVSA